jgi:uncharacterized protein
MFYTAVLLGFLGSFHCLGMCGPIAFVLPLDRHNKLKGFLQIFLYHFGRILSYALIGLLFGLLGKGLYLSGLQQKLSILIGAIMIFIVLVPATFLYKFTLAKPLYIMVNKLKKALGIYLKKSSLKAFFSIGFLNGFLPCGLVYMALFAAISTGSSLKGALYMAVFGIGTLPMMTAALLFGNFLKVSIRNKIQKAIPIFVVLIGLLFILRGLGLGIKYVSPPDHKLEISSKPMMKDKAYFMYFKDEKSDSKNIRSRV